MSSAAALFLAIDNNVITSGGAVFIANNESNTKNKCVCGVLILLFECVRARTPDRENDVDVIYSYCVCMYCSSSVPIIMCPYANHMEGARLLIYFLCICRQTF